MTRFAASMIASACVLAGCNVLDGGVHHHTSNVEVDAGADDPACGGTIGCGEGRHCEVQCREHAGECGDGCHRTCALDVSFDPVATCGDANVALYCLMDCNGSMADLCDTRCTPPDPAACGLLDEPACATRDDCMVITTGVGCTCELNTCTCASDGAFLRCEERK